MSRLAELTLEFSGCQFGDLRLSKRAQRLADALSGQPHVSIPAVMKSKADIEACYRFFDNDKVTPEAILLPHIKATRERIDQVEFALLVQDTTELELTRPEKQVAGAGPIDRESRRGAFYHPMIAFDAVGVPLGIVGQKSWVRKGIRKASKQAKLKRRRNTPIEEKESIRWLQGLQCAEQTAIACPDTTCVCVGDSESDIFDVFAAAHESDQDNLRLLIRAGQKRNADDKEDWKEAVRETAVVGSQSKSVLAKRKAKTQSLQEIDRATDAPQSLRFAKPASRCVAPYMGHHTYLKRFR